MNTVSIIIPAKDEEEHIAEAVRSSFSALKKFQIDGEVIAVNDGSRDNTESILKELQKDFSGLKIVSHIKSCGIGGAFMSGLEQAKMHYAFLVPGDNENDPQSVLRHFIKISNEDVLISYVENTEARSFFRRNLSKTYTLILNLFFNKSLKYYNGTSIYKIEALKKIDLQCSSFFFSAEILLKLLKEQPSYKEVPVLLTQTSQKKSHALSLKSLKNVSKDFIYMIYWQYVLTGRKSL